MAGILYIVATPIGNLDDMPPRVAATFGAADFVAAEDTRVTMRLLNYLGLKKPMVSYYEHALQKGEGILRRIEAGENCALCSDAGMPCVSDPGEVIVRDALARGIKVVPVPAASACVTALAVSGQDTSRWVFEGFLPVNKKQKRERLAELQGEKRTVIFYEAPHKLRTTLDDLTAAFGEEVALLVDGVIAGVGGVLTFLPQIAILFLFLSFLEDSGYMARAAFIMDRLLRRFGLSGKAFIPMLMGFGCTVPAVMGARTMENEKDRRMTIMLVPFMSCSARLPVYGLLTAAFFPQYGGLVVFSLYLL